MTCKRGFCVLVVALSGLALLTLASPALAAGEPPAPLFAGITTYFSGMATRSRVIQICVVVMSLAILIMVKKFEGGRGQGRAVSGTESRPKGKR